MSKPPARSTRSLADIMRPLATDPAPAAVPRAAPPKRKKETVGVNIHLDVDDHLRLKILVAKEGTSLHALFREGLDDALRKRGLPPLLPAVSTKVRD